MKKIAFLLFLTVSTLTFINCTDDDDRDCFECRGGMANIRYCENGENYTVTTIGTAIILEHPLGDQTWGEFRTEMEEICNNEMQ